MSRPDPRPPEAGAEEASPAFLIETSRAEELAARFLAFGAGALEDSHYLEILCDLDEEMAWALLGAFGSLIEVLGASAADLQRVAGSRAALRIKIAQALADRALRAPLRRRAVLGSCSLVSDHLRLVMAGAPREQFRVLFLDKRHHLIADELMSEGTFDQAAVYPREVVRRALELNAAGMVLAHNHPGGDPNPSPADISITAEVTAAARALRIAVHDHLIVAGDVVTSFRTRGLM